MGSKILNGDRKLTAAHLRKLSDHFHVDASLFL
jgi:antitoxin component HigA of HigAB toxin-antitoxin module